eukprot:4260326-Pyramimonas_sp.AAC.1
MERGGGPPAYSTSSKRVLAPDATQHHRSGTAGFPAAAAHVHRPSASLPDGVKYGILPSTI